MKVTEGGAGGEYKKEWQDVIAQQVQIAQFEPN